MNPPAGTLLYMGLMVRGEREIDPDRLFCRAPLVFLGVHPNFADSMSCETYVALGQLEGKGCLCDTA